MRLTGIIILLLLRFSSAVVIEVDTCPSDEESWLERSSKFKCRDPNEVYHCIKSRDGHLIETCMKSYVIKSYKDGCPSVHIKNGVSYLRSPFLACDAMHPGCPETFHKEYSTNELYLYPTCISHSDSTTSHKRYSITERPRTTLDVKQTRKADSVTGTFTTAHIIGMFILGMCLGFIIRWFGVEVICGRLCKVKSAISQKKEMPDLKVNRGSKLEFITEIDESCQSSYIHQVEPQNVSEKTTEEPCLSVHSRQLEPLRPRIYNKGYNSVILRKRMQYDKNRFPIYKTW